MPKSSQYRNFMYSCTIDNLPPQFRSRKSRKAYLTDNLPRGSQWAFLVHNSDVYTVEDEQKNSAHKANTPKTDHLHISVSTPSAKTISAIAKCLGVPVNTIQKFTGRNAKQNLFSYLVHKTEGSKKDGKHVYDYSEVESNFDFKSFVEGVSKSIHTASLDKDVVQEQILNGDLRMIDFIMDDKYTGFYLKNKTFVSNTIDTLYKRRMNSPEQQKVKIIYIQGESGAGKSTYARYYAKKHYRDYCVSSSANDSVQDYLGQDVMIFDEARPKDFKASEWLKLLDPYNHQSSVISRFYNKYLSVKCIIITSTVEWHKFFTLADNEGIDESIDQFMRRFDNVIIAEKLIQYDKRYAHLTIYPVVSVNPENNSERHAIPGSKVKYYHYWYGKNCANVDYEIADLHPHNEKVDASEFL